MTANGNPTGPVGRIARLVLAASCALVVSGLSAPSAEASQPREGAHRQQRAEARHSQPRRQQAPSAQRQQRGVASYYARKFNGRRTASGVRFDPNSNMAAHRTLPFGTVARVTNLSNGLSAIVEIVDNGPHIRGRILDLSPRTARNLDMHEAGTATVLLEPISVPAIDRRR